MSIVTIVDYGTGNLASVKNAFANVGADAGFARTPEEILSASKLVLPGVGAAGIAMARLRERGLDQALTEAVRQRGRPLLGICLGMQLIAESLYEYGEHRGLGWVRGDVVPLRDVGVRHPVPHMGWNEVAAQESARPFFGAVPRRRSQFYFTHSYTLRVADERLVAGYTDYGARLVSAVLDETVFAVQFHPEKSQQSGQQLIAAFLAWNP